MSIHAPGKMARPDVGDVSPLERYYLEKRYPNRWPSGERHDSQMIHDSIHLLGNGLIINWEIARLKIGNYLIGKWKLPD